MTPQRVRILRNLKINEISGVDKGAGRGVRIMLMKRQQEDSPMPTMDMHKAAASIDALVAIEMVKDKCISKCAAYDRVLSTGLGRELYLLERQRAIAANDPNQPVNKGAGGNNYGSAVAPSATTAAEGRNSGAYDGRPPGPYFTESGATALSRYRGSQALEKFGLIVDSHVQNGMKRSAAQQRAISENPDLWAACKAA